MPRFDFPVFHPNFEDHQAQAGRRIVSDHEAEEVWYSEGRRFVGNRKRPGTYLMKGLTDARRAVTVLVLPTGDPETWLLYTAWDTKHTD